MGTHLTQVTTIGCGLAYKGCMTVSEVSYQLLQLLREYRQAILGREALRVLLLARDPNLSGELIQDVQRNILLVSAPKFEKAEQQLLDGTHPQTVLSDFLRPKRWDIDWPHLKHLGSYSDRSAPVQ